MGSLKKRIPKGLNVGRINPYKKGTGVPKSKDQMKKKSLLQGPRWKEVVLSQSKTTELRNHEVGGDSGLELRAQT